MSQLTQNLLRRLRDLWNHRASPASPAEAVQDLREIARAGRVGAVPGLFPLLFDSDPGIARAAADAIHAIVTAADPLDLARLDGVVRRSSDWEWARVLPSMVVPTSHGLTGALGVLSMNASGHARQAAVEALAGVRDGVELPFLLIRLNDWVGPVRRAALAAIHD